MFKFIDKLLNKHKNKFLLQFSHNLKKRALWLIVGTIVIAFQVFPAMAKAEEIPMVVEVRAREFFDRAIKEIEQGNYGKAVVDFTKTIEIEPEWTKAYSNRCLAHIYLQNYQKAELDCTRVIATKPNNTQAYLNRGLAYYRLGHLAAALFDYNRAIELEPDSVEARYNRGLVYAAQNNYNDAIADYDRALSQISSADSAQLATIYNDRGLAYWQLQNLDLAIADFHQVISLDSKQPWAYFNLALLYYQQKKYNDAVTYYTRSLQRHPDYAEAYINRGLAFYQLGYHQAALKDLHFGCECFCHQGKDSAYQNALALIEKLKKNLSNLTNLIV